MMVLGTSKIRSRTEAMFRRAPEMAVLRWQTTDNIPYESAERWRGPELDTRSLALLQYTSGSTSDP
jgi:acyl-CoA synthetase (AMP-forming)/AMP-acid ligase II